MGCKIQSKNSMIYFLVVVLVIVFSLLASSSSSQARPLFQAKELVKLRTETSRQMSREDLAAMLPKGTPVPPSGPSLGINYISK
ncbi:hypothetical protein TIFTF001_001882 [Ficus carica]|uniref:Uncharacterized protein n=1 Tax=Ficus carica TaxID=3494 RepID=A0AA88CN55_FICCA|nr:hypothetical protein TIFTF001_001882 [Ficus carica]